MATLNVKGFPDGLYRKLQARARKDRRSLAQEVIYLLQEVVETPKPLSLLELKGLGHVEPVARTGPAQDGEK